MTAPLSISTAKEEKNIVYKWARCAAITTLLDRADFLVSSSRDSEFRLCDPRLRRHHQVLHRTLEGRALGFFLHRQPSDRVSVKLSNTLRECKYTIKDAKGHTEWVSCVRFSQHTRADHHIRLVGPNREGVKPDQLQVTIYADWLCRLRQHCGCQSRWVSLCHRGQGWHDAFVGPG